MLAGVPCWKTYELTSHSNAFIAFANYFLSCLLIFKSRKCLEMVLMMKSRSWCLSFGTSLTNSDHGTSRPSTSDWNMPNTSEPHCGSCPSPKGPRLVYARRADAAPSTYQEHGGQEYQTCRCGTGDATLECVLNFLASLSVKVKTKFLKWLQCF